MSSLHLLRNQMASEIIKSPNLKSSNENVEITDEVRNLGFNASQMLRDLGIRSNPDSTTYLGSIALHIYANVDLLDQARSIQTVTMQVGKEQGESVYESVSSGVLQACLETFKQAIVRDITGQRPKTLNRKDRRS